MLYLGLITCWLRPVWISIKFLAMENIKYKLCVSKIGGIMLEALTVTLLTLKDVDPTGICVVCG